MHSTSIVTSTATVCILIILLVFIPLSVSISFSLYRSLSGGDDISLTRTCKCRIARPENAIITIRNNNVLKMTLN